MRNKEELIVYHLALSQNAKIWEEYEYDIKKILPKIKIVLFDCLTKPDFRHELLRKTEEKTLNMLSQGMISPKETSKVELTPGNDTIPEKEQWKITEQFVDIIYDSKKEIVLEKNTREAWKHWQKSREARNRMASLFYSERYREATLFYEEEIRQTLEEIRLRDKAISKQIDKLLKKKKKNILLVLPPGHSISIEKGKIIRFLDEELGIIKIWKEIERAVYDDDFDGKEEFWLGHICRDLLENYFVLTGKDTKDSFRRSYEIINQIPKARIRELCSFINDTEKGEEEVIQRLIIWLKENGYISEKKYNLK